MAAPVADGVLPEESEGLLSEDNEDIVEEIAKDVTETPTSKPNQSKLSSFFLGILSKYRHSCCGCI